MSASRARAAAERLRRDGCIVFERALPDAVCDRLAAFAAQTPAKVRRMDHEAKGAAARTALYDPVAPLAVRYDYATTDLLDNADVQALLADPSILALMQEYLGCRPVADVLSMWWHTSFHRQPDSEAAQFFHFDLDRIKWLKIFVYLTDVGPENGPHSFVRGSHRTGGIPTDFLRRGYVRWRMRKCMRPTRPKTCSSSPRRAARSSSKTRADCTRAPACGRRALVLQLQFSNSLFGTSYPPARISTVRDPALASLLGVAPDIYEQYA